MSLTTGGRQYKAVQEREAFQKLEQLIASAIDEIMIETGRPLYTDTFKGCSMQAPQKFSEKKLHCDMMVSAYYRISPEKGHDFALHAKDVLERKLSIGLSRSSIIKSADVAQYGINAHRMEEIGMDNITCGVEVRHPAGLEGGGGLPSRNFRGESVMSVGISCYKHAVKPIYPMVDY